MNPKFVNRPVALTAALACWNIIHAARVCAAYYTESCGSERYCKLWECGSCSNFLFIGMCGDCNADNCNYCDTKDCDTYGYRQVCTRKQYDCRTCIKNQYRDGSCSTKGSDKTTCERCPANSTSAGHGRVLRVQMQQKLVHVQFEVRAVPCEFHQRAGCGRYVRVHMR